MWISMLPLMKKWGNSDIIVLLENGYAKKKTKLVHKSHQANDRAVMKAFGMPIRETDEAACVAWLMRLYQEKISEIEK